MIDVPPDIFSHGTKPDPMRVMLLQLWLATLRDKIKDDPDAALEWVQGQIDRLNAIEGEKQ